MTGFLFDGIFGISNAWIDAFIRLNIVVAVMTLIVGSIFLRETKDVDIIEGSGVANMAPAERSDRFDAGREPGVRLRPIAAQRRQDAQHLAYRLAD